MLSLNLKFNSIFELDGIEKKNRLWPLYMLGVQLLILNDIFGLIRLRMSDVIFQIMLSFDRIMLPIDRIILSIDRIKFFYHFL